MRPIVHFSRSLPAIAAALLVPATALAHGEVGAAEGLVTGFLHPLLGLDHVIAMLAVGLWGAQLRAPAIWLLPINFPLVMALGGMLGVAGVSVPAVEIGIAASALVLGLLITFALRLPIWTAMLIVSVFAIFHGHAHGTELPHATHPLSYGVGFVTATGLLHLVGILLGQFTAWRWGEWMVRACGVLIALGGGWFLWASL